MTRLPALVLTALFLRACDTSGSAPASGGAAGTPSAKPAPPTGPAAAPATRLHVTVKADASSAPREATLECGSVPVATGFITDAAAACRAVAENADRLQPPPPGRMCTAIYGGPQEARVTGTAAGKAVDRTIRRTDGCGISDWTALEP